MSNPEGYPSISLTIHLIKKGLRVDEVVMNAPSLRRQTLQINPEVAGELFIETRQRKRPRWARFFEGFVNDSEFGWVSSSSALLLVNLDNRVIALTFGYGGHLLNPDCWEERFGLIVALNSIRDGEVRSIDKRIFDSISRRTREQASRAATVREFGVDIETDLLRAVTGKPSDERLGKLITGAEALNVHVSVGLAQLPGLLELYERKSRQKTYRKNYPWVDQIAEVPSTELKQVLDAQVLELIRARRFDRCWLAPPTIVDWSRVRGFAYGTGVTAPIHYDMHLETFLDSLKDGSDIDGSTLHRRRVVEIGENDQPFGQWSVYRCLNCEVELEGSTYVLSEGKWYKVASDFVAEVNRDYAAIPKSDIDFPEYNGGDEYEYNRSVASSAIALLDQDLIYIQGGRDKIEFCDLLTSNKDIIHVKKYAGSAVLSHLFNQGLVSGEYFQLDCDFRQKVNEKLPSSFQLRDPKTRPHPQEYQVIFAIISRSEGDLTLPFFSRVSVRHVVRRLDGFGYRVALGKIAVSERARKLKKVRGRRS